MTHQDIQGSVREGYGAIARAGLTSEQSGIKSIATAFGYSEEELASIPAEANMGLSCGNPVAMASISEGETVVDLGSGGGLDVFLAAKKVGPSGKAIGIDMTGDMISLARRNAKKGGYQNVKFYLAEIEAIPLPNDSVDCIISNCVLNLCEDKDAAFAEIYRILKPGGRLAVSDIALKKPLPDQIRDEVAAWTGCIAGAMTIDENRSKLDRAGFGEVVVVDSNADLNAYRDGGHSVCCGPESVADMSGGCCSPQTSDPLTECCSSESVTTVQLGGLSSEKANESSQNSSDGNSEFHNSLGQLLDTFDVNEFAASVKIFATKPA